MEGTTEVHIIKWLKRPKKKLICFLPKSFMQYLARCKFSFPAFLQPSTNTLELPSPPFVSWKGQDQGLPRLATTTHRPSTTPIAGDTPAPHSRTNLLAEDQGRRNKFFPSSPIQQRHKGTRVFFAFGCCVNTEAIRGCLQLWLHRDLPRPDPALIPHCSNHPKQMQEPLQDQVLN